MGPHRAGGTGPIRIAMIGLRGIPATYGGVERAVEELAACLAARDHAVTVYARNGYSDVGESTYRGVELRHLPFVNTKHMEAVTHTLLAVGDALRSKEFDVVHLHATGPAMFSVLPKLTGVPCVVTVQGLDWKREKWGFVASQTLKLGARVAATVPDATIVVSRTLDSELRRRYGTTPAYIPNGVDLAGLEGAAPVAGLEAGDFALFLGRLVPEKGVHRLIEAFRAVDTSARLAICGPSSHSDDYVRELHELANGDPRVVFVGPRYGEEKAWLLKNARVFVQPSTIEGLPITLLEALACGRAAIVSDIPENVEAVTFDGEPLARVFRAEDVGDLAAKLQDALDQPVDDAEQRRVSELIVNEYNWERIADSTEQIYRQVLNGRSRAVHRSA